MAAQIQIVSTLDNEQTVAGFVETEKAAKATADATQKAVTANKSFQQQLRQLRKEQDGLDLDERIKRVKQVFDSAAPSVDKLTAEIKEYQSLAIAAGRTTPVGREFLEKAAQAKDQLVDLQNETKRLSDDNRNLQGAIQGIGVGVSAFAGVTAAATLFGDKNEELQKVLVRVTAAQTLLNSVQQIQVALQKESSLRLAINNGLEKAKLAISKEGLIATQAQIVQTKIQSLATLALAKAQGLYNTIVGTSTGALKAFRVALLSTGVGALVVGLGLLVANFDSVVSFVGEAIEGLGGLKNALLFILAPIGAIVAAFEFLFGATTEQNEAERELEEERRKASEANSKRTKKKIEEIKAEQKKFKEAAEKENELLEVRVQILENTGKASDESRLKILENNRAIVASELEAVQKIIQAKTEQFKAEAEIRGQTEEEFKAQLKAQGVDLDELQKRAAEITDGLQLDIELAESEITKFKREQNEERTKNAQAAADKQAKIQEDLLKRQIDALNKLDEVNISLIQDQQEREEAALQFKFEQRIAKLDANIAEEKKLLEALETKFLLDLENLRTKAQEEELKKVFEQGQKLDQLRIQILQTRLSEEKNQIELQKQIQQFQFQEELENLRFELESKEITEEEFRLRQQLLEEQNQQALVDIEKEGAKKRTEAALKEADKKIGAVAFFVNSAAQLNDLFNKIQDNQLKEGEQLSVKAQKKRFQREKAFNIASALVNGAKAVTQAIAQFGPPPSPLGIAGVATAGIITAAQVAAIASQKFNPESGSSGGGGSASGSVGGFAPTIATATQPQAANIPTTQTGASSQGGESQFEGTGTTQTSPNVIKAFVVSGELTSAAEAEQLIDEQSTL